MTFLQTKQKIQERPMLQLVLDYRSYFRTSSWLRAQMSLASLASLASTRFRCKNWRRHACRPPQRGELSGAGSWRGLHGPQCGRLQLGAHVCTKLHTSASHCADLDISRCEALYCPRPQVACDVRTPDARGARLCAARGPLSGSEQSDPLYPRPSPLRLCASSGLRHSDRP